MLVRWQTAAFDTKGYSLTTKEIDIKNQGLDVAARSAATSDPSLGREYRDVATDRTTLTLN